MAAQSATRTAIILSIQSAMIAWGHNPSPAQIAQMVNHIEFDINTNSATALADVTADLATWPKNSYNRNS